MTTRSGGEPPAKKRALSPIHLPVTPLKPVEDGLPIKLTDGEELPTLSTQQSQNLSNARFQSIAERFVILLKCLIHADHFHCFSGVLEMSIERSRQAWLLGGLFERYWIKPSKKKTTVDARNPPKDSMTRLGVCSIIIEPHVFEATLYVVKDSQPAFALPQPQAPTPPPDMRYSSFSHVAIYPPLPRNIPAVEHPHDYTQQRASLPQPKSAHHQACLGPGEPPVHHKPPIVPNTGSSSRGPDITWRSQIRGAKSKVRIRRSASDPVIQMLAAKAVNHPGLKALMTVVASGEATPRELKVFKVEIDELAHLHKSRTKHSQDSIGQPLPSIPPFNERASTNQSRVPLPPLNIGPLAEPATPEPLPPIFYPHAPFPKPKGITSHKSDITGVVVDIGGLGDRYLFPKNSILEYHLGGAQVTVSFLITRKGSEAASKGYKNSVNYYQPVTMRLSSLQPRILEPLARIVAPPDEVRKNMEKVFDAMTRANDVFLATRLPRTTQATLDNDDSSVCGEQSLLPTVYSPPHMLTPMTPRYT